MDNVDIKVSVIMPIYNADEYLRIALDGVLAQTLSDFELICIDDGSTDSSLKILKEYHEKDERVRIVTENNAGPSIARNKGIVRARGEYVIFLDADDFYEPTLLSSLYEAAVKDDLDVAVARFDIFNNKQQKYTAAVEEIHSDIFASGQVVSKNEYPDCILQSTTGYVWNKLFKTSFIKEKELTFAPELYVFEDVHFVCTALSLAERVARIDGILIHHRVYSDQSRAKLFKKYYSQVPVVYLRIKEFLTSHGMYIPLSRSFLNLSVSRCYKIYNLLWSDAKESFWDLLHSGYADSLGWYRHEQADFEEQELYEFAINIGLYTHSQYKSRSDKGRKLKVEKLKDEQVKKRIKNVKREEKVKQKIEKANSKISGPFKKLFGIFRIKPKKDKTE